MTVQELAQPSQTMMPRPALTEAMPPRGTGVSTALKKNADHREGIFRRLNRVLVREFDA
jgi:hypothetical protein